MRKSVRISGLVRLANQVRQTLAHPPTATHAALLRRSVELQIADLTTTLAARGLSESALATPSRRALQFLKSVPWDRIPQGASAPPIGRVRAPALSAYAKRMQRIFADPLTAGSVDALRSSLQTNLNQFSGALRSAGQTLDAMTKNARADLAWVSLLASEDYLEKYLSAVRTASAIFQRVAPAAGCRLPVLIHFVPLAGIFRFRSSPRGTTVMLPIGMIAFGSADFEDIAAFSLGSDASRRQAVLQRLRADAFQEVRELFDVLSGNVGQPQGAFHDLNASFDRVNAHYFQGTMARPRLIWGKTFTRNKLGHYEPVSDTLLISASLDQAQVPQSALDYLMYHELLHKKYPAEWKNGRGYVHTPTFKRDEQQFEGWEAAEKQLHQIARGGPIN